MISQSELRAINGIVLLDKPPGITSNAALQSIKRLFRARKAGHTGSLDPMATGLLPLCFGAATKISAFLLEADKRYRVVIKLGVKTATGDAEGDIIATRPVGNIDPVQIREILKRFTGAIQQIPPMHSAIKHHGQPLYKLAHKGIEVERQARPVIVHELHMLASQGEFLELDVACSKGTYIRTLAEDIGEALGLGAHVSALRRTAAGPFRAEQMVTMPQLESAAGNFASLDGYLLPMETALQQWPEVRLSEDLAHYLCQGQAVFVPRAPAQGWVKLCTVDQRFLGVGHVLDDGRVAPKRLIGGIGG